MYIARGKGFEPPQPSPYLSSFHPLCGNYTGSEVALSLIREDIKQNRMNEHAQQPNDRLMTYAIQRAFHAFKLPNKPPLLHLSDVFQQDLPIWNSSPGLQWNQCGYRTMGDIRRDPDAIKRIRYFWYQIKTGHDIRLSHCCAYVRSHICERGESKVRVVWGYPATVTFGEAVFAVPLIRAYRKHPILQRFRGTQFLGIDFSEFDNSLPSWLMKAAFSILAYNLDFTRYQDHGIPHTDRAITMWETITDYFIHTRIMMCNGKLYRKKSGLASGSYFTQLVGSICNYILLTYAALKCHVRFENLFVFGNDSVMSTCDRFTPDHIQEVLDGLGMTFNVAKSPISRNISYLPFLGYGISNGYPPLIDIFK
uniref:RNA-dependent RNA polymerase n=1 Tax=Varnsen partiti-like virus TaxID=2716667 RepID=A0A6G7PSP4_9VIRU|nr:RNA-dependent RNA polymerase [Varnsen partiti-like virus]